MRNRLKLYFVIMGLVISAASTAHAAYTFTQIDYPGATDTLAQGINDSGNIVGYYNDGTKTRGFLHVGGSFTPIEYPNATLTYAQGINDSNSIVGYYNDAKGVHGFLYAGGSFSR